jgi:hypothetical protein
MLRGLKSIFAKGMAWVCQDTPFHPSAMASSLLFEPSVSQELGEEHDTALREPTPSGRAWACHKTPFQATANAENTVPTYP